MLSECYFSNVTKNMFKPYEDDIDIESSKYCFIPEETLYKLKPTQCVERKEREIKGREFDEKVIEAILDPDEPTPDYSLKRVEIFLKLNPICKQVLMLLYSSYDNFIQSVPHPLEELIVLIHKFWESEESIRAIGSRWGIYVGVDDYYQAWEILVDRLVSIIEKMRDEDEGEIKRIINMNRNEFKKWCEENSVKYSEEIYQDRLTVFVDKRARKFRG